MRRLPRQGQRRLDLSSDVDGFDLVRMFEDPAAVAAAAEVGSQGGTGRRVEVPAPAPPPRPKAKPSPKPAAKPAKPKPVAKARPAKSVKGRQARQAVQTGQVQVDEGGSETRRQSQARAQARGEGEEAGACPRQEARGA